MKKNVALLATCQALLQSCNALLVASSGLVSLALAPSPSFATVALGIQFLATMSLTLPASLLMRRIGRRQGFLIGTALGFVGGVLFSLGIFLQNYGLFCAGAASFGAFNAFGQYYRFAAADVASEDFRSRAISLVLAGGIVAAILGPNLANGTRDLVDNHAFLGCYLSLIILALISMSVIAFISIPVPTGAERHKRGRPLVKLVVQPSYFVAVLGAMVAYGAMNLIMVSTPLAMSMDGMEFHQAASVIQWHILGMYAPSFFTGHLIHRFGVLNIMMAGVLVMFLCTLVNLSVLSDLRYWIALFLLGLGWNFTFTGATTLLTQTYRSEEKAVAQGFNDLLVFGTMTLTAASSGALLQTFGWSALNIAIMPALCVTFAFSAWLRFSHHRIFLDG